MFFSMLLEPLQSLRRIRLPFLIGAGRARHVVIVNRIDLRQIRALRQSNGNPAVHHLNRSTSYLSSAACAFSFPSSAAALSRRALSFHNAFALGSLSTAA